MCFASAGAKLENMNQQAVQLQQDVDLYGQGETNGGKGSTVPPFVCFYVESAGAALKAYCKVMFFIYLVLYIRL